MKKLFFFVLIFLSLAFMSCSDSNPVLTIEGGKVNGIQTVTKGIIAYKGIPFAAPPVGNLRWKEPHIAIRITKQ
jgi:para-nitrobenzyl esterase